MVVLSRKYNTILKSALEVVPNVYQLTIGGVNVILIAEEELTLIDTGFRGISAQIVDFIRSLGRSPEEISLIILTHNHLDHMGGLPGLKRFTSAKVAIHKADISNTEAQLSHPRAKRKLLRILPFFAFRSVISLKAKEVDIQLEGGEVLKPLGGLRVIHTPGHTPGSISLFSPSNKLLIAGDALNKHGKTLRLPPKLASTDLAQALDSIKKMTQLDFDILCFGHGRPLTEDVHIRIQDLIERTKH